jgi:hypothetical protein
VTEEALEHNECCEQAFMSSWVLKPIVLQGSVGKALDAAGAGNARGFFAPIAVTAHCSNGCGMRSLGSFAAVRDPA